MDADDPRHGTLNGYNTHNRDGEKACDACLAGRAASRKDTRTGRNQTAKPPKWTNYIVNGYDDNDGLEGGRWMWDDRRAVRVWVQTEEPKPKPQKTGPRAHCIDCDEPVDRRALRCRPHAQAEAARIKREWNRKARAQVAA